MSQPTSNTPTSKEELLARLRAQRERAQGGSVAPRSEPFPQPSVPVPKPAQPSVPSQVQHPAPSLPLAVGGSGQSSIALAMLAKKAAALRAQQEAAAEAERIANLPPPPPPAAKELACTPELKERCAELVAACQNLAQALLQQEPQLGQFLADIHEHLRAEPELMHIMTDEQIAATYQGFIAQSGKAIIAAKPKSAAAKAKAIALKEAEDDGL